jgi:hypothetical protein
MSESEIILYTDPTGHIRVKGISKKKHSGCGRKNGRDVLTNMCAPSTSISKIFLK